MFTLFVAIVARVSLGEYAVRFAIVPGIVEEQAHEKLVSADLNNLLPGAG